MLLPESIDLACAPWTLLKQCVSIGRIFTFDDPIEFNPFIVPDEEAVVETNWKSSHLLTANSIPCSERRAHSCRHSSQGIERGIV